MHDSVYAPPKADLSKRSDAGSDGDNAFYVVSTRKLALLFFLTLGLYQIYWFYKNWSSYKDRCRYASSQDQNIWPIPRALFSVFFVHSLFRKVEEYAIEKMRPLNWNISSDATLLVALLILSNVMGRLAGKNIGSPYTDYISLLLLVPLYFSFHRAQQFINISCGDPQGISNSKLTGANWAWMFTGAVFCLLAAVGLFMPELGK
ncbi:hypothetical protein [Massilia sp. TWP1-3-3]|uniref:hypothetical protein n=1 Tax=Massilia sp. TWP1-3-3 TaxID=2804573 RepID=UPI003CEC6A16